ncbi:MAG: thiamine-phosphate kinase [Acidobacteria bacterium]|nr:thiamine-phosphate kinase [Acidobacteriota bacterium]
MTEDRLIDKIQAQAARSRQAGIRLGIGDDTAVLKPLRAGLEMLVTTDQIIENTHFTRAGHPAGALGWKCLARGLSDIAAMGGKSGHFLLSLALPAWTLSNGWLKQFLSEMFQLADLARIPLIGGDVARSDRFAANVTVIGSVAAGTALRRDRARPGDIVYVSGKLGGSALGFECLQARSKLFSDPAVLRHIRPEPRLGLGDYLRKTGRARAAMDLSDGLSTDAARLAKASKAGIEINEAAVPRFDGASLEQALHGGEDYELLFTASPDTRVPKSWRGLPLTAIGSVVKRRGLAVVTAAKRRPLPPRGFRHF